MAETFGLTTKGGTKTMVVADIIHACKFTAQNTGTLSKMSLYVKQELAYTPNIKCALYDSSYDLVANSGTEAKQVAAAQDDWMEFNFITPPSVTAATVYYLSQWADSGKYNVYQNTGSVNQWKWQILEYNSWPSFFSYSGQANQECSIYATYVEAPTYIPKVIMVE